MGETAAIMGRRQFGGDRVQDGLNNYVHGGQSPWPEGSAGLVNRELTALDRVPLRTCFSAGAGSGGEPFGLARLNPFRVRKTTSKGTA